MTGPTTVPLTHDGALAIAGAPAAVRQVRAWIPHRRLPSAALPRARIELVPPPRDAAGFVGEATLSLGGVEARCRGHHVALRGAGGWMGDADLDALHATIPIAPHVTSLRQSDVWGALTLSAAFLVGRMGGALVHAAAAVDPDGRAWLLAGDTHSGKTTTCASLAAIGWRYLADDQVVLRAADGGVVVEGWPRLAHLDEGWTAGEPRGTRRAVNLETLLANRWQRTAPLGGLAFPSVSAGEPTQATAIAPADAFGRLLRQSPWLLADRGSAAPVLALLTHACSAPAAALSLGADGYGRGAVIAAALGRQVRA